MADLDWNNVPKDLCPVCKTDKYLSPEIEFKINPECYHKICDACVDRIFALGPTKCPYPSCEKILRKNKFKAQVFDDIQVERECDIRRRVLLVYNKKENDFDSLDQFNAYLEEIEEIIYKLMNGIDIEATEDKLKEYSLANKQSIELNNARRDQEYEKFIRLQKLERQYKSERNRLNREIMKEEANMKNLTKIEVINQLQNASTERDPDKVVDEIRSSMMKRTNKYREELVKLDDNYDIQKDAIKRNINLNEKNKKSKVPFTPFNGDNLYELPFKFQMESYKDTDFDKIVNDVQYTAAGYDIKNYYMMALNDAFTGISIDVEVEKGSPLDPIL